MHAAFQRMRTPTAYRFFAYLSLICGGAVVARMRYDIALTPIAHRFHLEFEIGAAAIAAALGLFVLARLPRPLQIAAVVLCSLFAGRQALVYAGASHEMTRPLDFTTTAEYKMGQAFASLYPDKRVFAPGSTSYWMSHFNDVPLFNGCCDQSVAFQAYRHVRFAIYDDNKAFADHGAAISAMWLNVYGTDAVGVMADGSSRLGQPYGNIHKFDGVLPEVWREPSVGVIYRVPRANGALAHVIPRSVLLPRDIGNAIDLEPVLPLANALDHPRSLATFQWHSQHEADIGAETQAGEVIYVQQTCDAGWHAIENGAERLVECDRLGQMVIDPEQPGSHVIRLAYGATLEDRYTRITQVAGALLLVIWTWRARRWTATLTAFQPPH
jgi:hypothetical protein